jgi:hypothetical protein
MSRIQKRLWGWILGVFAASLLGGASTGFAQPDQIMLGQSIQNRQRTEVDFPHGLHMETLDCLDCHHRYEEGKNVLDSAELEEGAGEVTCNACHDAKSDIDLREAFHHQCIGCHIAMRKEGKKSGPELCGQCHPKPKAATK